MAHWEFAVADHQFVGAEGLSIEEDAGLESPLFVERRVLCCLGEFRNVDSEVGEQTGGIGAIGARTINEQRAAVHQIQMSIQIEFVALGMAAEIIVVVENEDAALGCSRTVKVCGRQAADAAANDDQVVFFAGIGCRRPALAIA